MYNGGLRKHRYPGGHGTSYANERDTVRPAGENGLLSAFPVSVHHDLEHFLGGGRRIGDGVGTGFDGGQNGLRPVSAGGDYGNLWELASDSMNQLRRFFRRGHIQNGCPAFDPGGHVGLFIGDCDDGGGSSVN